MRSNAVRHDSISCDFPSVTQASTGHVPALDGLRGLAALYVMFFHYFANQAQTVPVLGVFIHYGFTGVALFFVLSGYLITRILIEQRKSRYYWKAFYLRRALRILPLYFFVVFLGFALLKYMGTRFYGRIPPLSPFLMLSVEFWMSWNNISEIWGPLSVLWSIGVEEKFYLMIAPAARAVRPRFLGASLLLALFAILAINLARLHYGWGGLWGYCSKWGPEALLVGSFLACLTTGICLENPRTRAASWVLLLGGAFLVFFPFGLSHLARTTFQARFSFFYASILFFLLTHSESILAHILGSGALSWLGKISFGIYMFHLLVSFLASVIVRKLGVISDVLVPAACVLGTLLLATLSYEFFEKRFIAWGRNRAPWN